MQQLHSHAELCHPSACRQTDTRQTTHQVPEACPSFSFHATCMHTHTVHMYAGIRYTRTHKNTSPNECAVWDPWGSCVVCNGAMAECLRTAHHLEIINLAVVRNDPTMHAMHACAHVQAPTTFKTEYSPPLPPRHVIIGMYHTYIWLDRFRWVCALFLSRFRCCALLLQSKSSCNVYKQWWPYLSVYCIYFYFSDVGGVVLGWRSIDLR